MTEFYIFDVMHLYRNVIRLVKSDGNYQLHFSTENSKIYHGYQPQFVELPNEVRKILFNKRYCVLAC